MTLEAFTLPLSCGGVILVIYSLTLYSKCVKVFGAKTLARAGLLLSVPGCLLIPSASLLSSFGLQQASSKQSTNLKQDLQQFPAISYWNCLHRDISIVSIAKLLATQAPLLVTFLSGVGVYSIDSR